jgi:hypothetical protein
MTGGETACVFCDGVGMCVVVVSWEAITHL